MAVWAAIFITAQTVPIIIGLASLAYGFGLRHAVDADHIAAIDNTTRKLMHEGKKPVGVGLFFSLGHSTIVILLSAFVALSTAYVNTNLPAFKEIGSLVGISISSIFLIVIGIINLIAFLDILKVWRHVTKGKHVTKRHVQEHLETKGVLARIFRPALKAVSNSWHMYFVGFLFGLGFDTASEVGILSLSAISGGHGIQFWQIMLLPLVFTVGMALIDTLDGVLMLGAYGWAYINPVRKLYYNMNITLISVVIALFIGGIEALQIISDKTGWMGGLFGIVNSLDIGNLGYIIILAFVLSWILSLLFYKYQRYDLFELQHR